MWAAPHTWEELCREWVLRAGAHGVLPLADQVGSYFSKTSQVDVVGINSMDKVLILGECKWSPKPMGAEVMETLMAKTAEVVPRQGRWVVHYVGFARGGWAPDTRARMSLPSGANWTSAGVLLRDLSSVDDELAAWSGSL